MKTFTGIASSHMEEAFDYVYAQLEKIRPTHISFERLFTFGNDGDSEEEILARVEAFYNQDGKVEFKKNISDILSKPSFFSKKELLRDIKVIEVYLNNHMILAKDWMIEQVAGNWYALDQDLPMYIVDTQWHPMNRRRELFEFTKHSHTCHDFTDHAVHTAGIEIERFYDHPGVNVFLRNLYQGDCLNYILSVLDAESLVHFGGGTHFDPCFKGRKQTDPRYTDDFTIQALVKADKKDVIFLEERNQ